MFDSSVIAFAIVVAAAYSDPRAGGPSRERMDAQVLEREHRPSAALGVTFIGSRPRVTPPVPEDPPVRRDRNDDDLLAPGAGWLGMSVAPPLKRTLDRRTRAERMARGPSIIILFPAFGVIGFLLSAVASFVTAAWVPGCRLFFLGFGGVSIALAGLCAVLATTLARRLR